MIETLKIWGLLGGLGSCAQRGFGSINLRSLEYNDEPVTTFDYSLPQYRDKINQLLTNYSDVQDFPPYFAEIELSKHLKNKLVIGN